MVRIWTCLAITLAVAALTLVPTNSTADAQCGTTFSSTSCHPVRVVQKVQKVQKVQVQHHAKVVHDQIITPVAVPLVFPVAVPTVSYSYNGPGHYQQPQQLQSGRTLTDADIEAIVQRLQGGGGAPPPAQQDPGEIRVNYSLDSVKALLSNKCAKCHTAPSHRADVAIFLSNGDLNLAAPWYKIWDQADAGLMPPAAKNDPSAALTDQESALLRIHARNN